MIFSFCKISARTFKAFQLVTVISFLASLCHFIICMKLYSKSTVYSLRFLQYLQFPSFLFILPAPSNLNRHLYFFCKDLAETWQHAEALFYFSKKSPSHLSFCHFHTSLPIIWLYNFFFMQHPMKALLMFSFYSINFLTQCEILHTFLIIYLIMDKYDIWVNM